MIEPGQLLKLTDADGREVYVYTDILVAFYPLEVPEVGRVWCLQLDRMLEGYGYSYVLLSDESGARVREACEGTCIDLTEPTAELVDDVLGSLEG